MGHPIMFDDADPLLARLRRICLALPDAAEKISHGRPNWYTTTVFAAYGGKVKGDHSDPLLDRALLFLPDPEDLPALEQDERIVVPAYVGVRGWRALPLDRPGEHGAGDPGSVDWDEVAELVESSYRQLAGARRVARLDAEQREAGRGER
ncbi:MmcQ/YjbR family DNA-binding protein [Dietzia sp. B19]|uniref:MmcQ/YjbR family DNA-binding protein n=1 Tax=Dietzia sp. B19 TaxID=1630632 RepID=UPI0015FD95DB|nr:MmcQ/YjbR family DNA-binding protein [Dietzia sp. B19]MBB1056008.1 MmcQ/YjbR family DNA-binding protein [Dietzia sp. B19]